MDELTQQLQALARHVLELHKAVQGLEARVDGIQEYLTLAGPPGPITVTVAPEWEGDTQPEGEK